MPVILDALIKARFLFLGSHPMTSAVIHTLCATGVESRCPITSKPSYIFIRGTNGRHGEAMKPDYQFAGVTGNYVFHGKEGWKIMKTNSFHNVVVIHICEKDPYHKVQWRYQGRSPCALCGKPAPDEIQALITLYNGAV